MKKRSEIAKEYKWDLSAIFPSDEAWEEEFQSLTHKELEFMEFKGELGKSSQNLLAYFLFEDEIEIRLENVYVYANQRLHEDSTNAKYQGYSAKAQALSIEMASLVAFVQPELLAIPEETISQFLKEEPRLAPFEKFLKDLFRKKKHILDEKTENLLAQAGKVTQAPYDIFAMFNNADARFADALDENGNAHPVSHGTYTHLLESSDRVLRKNAFLSMYKLYGDYKNTLAANFAANVKQAEFYADARGYQSAREMCLDDANIPEAVYDNLIDTVHKRMNLMHRYVAIRKKCLGLSELHMYDVYTPIVADYEMKVGYEEAKEIVKKGLAPLGEEYLFHLQEGFDNHWIDVYENEGKRSGAYSWGTFASHPYVLLNYQENLNNVFTIAHEMGHALHSWYSNHNQPHATADYKIFVAEVASTCNEALLMLYLIEHSTDKREKAYLLNMFMEQFKGTLFRQTMFAEFERDAHALNASGEGLTAQTLCEMYYKLNETYFGKDMIVDQQIELEWARIPHFYTPFYVYQYATGYSAAIALANRILKLGEKGVEDYMKFLTGGGSKDPIDLLKLAGVDMSSAKPIEEALDVFESVMNQFEEIYEV